MYLYIDINCRRQFISVYRYIDILLIYVLIHRYKIIFMQTYTDINSYSCTETQI